MKKQFILISILFFCVTQIGLSYNSLNWQAIKKDYENFGHQRYDISLWMAFAPIKACSIKGPAMEDYTPADYLANQDRWNWRSDNLTIVQLQQQSPGDWYLKIIDPNDQEAIYAFTVTGNFEDTDFLPVPDILEPADGASDIIAEHYVMSWDPNDAQTQADAQIVEISGAGFLYKTMNFDVSATSWNPGWLEIGEAKCAVVYVDFRQDLISPPQHISGPLISWDVFTAFLDSVDENHFTVRNSLDLNEDDKIDLSDLAMVCTHWLEIK